MDALGLPTIILSQSHPLCLFVLLPILLVICMSFIITFKSLSPNDKGLIKLPPYLKYPWPIIGDLPQLSFSNKPPFRWIHQLMKDMNTEIACIKLGKTHVIPITSPEICCEVLKKQDVTFASRPPTMATNLITNGYLSTALTPFGDQWRKMRKVVSHHLLSQTKMQWIHDKRIEEANNLVRFVYNQCCDQNSDLGGVVNVRVSTQQYCGNVIRKLVFGRRYFGEGRGDGGPGFKEVEHVSAMFTCLKYLYAFNISDYFSFLRELDIGGHKTKVKKAINIFDKYHDPLIGERIQQWKNGDKENIEDWLDILITLKDSNDKALLTPKEIKAQIVELMIATIDNPSNAFEWAIAEMINQPELLEKATQELDNVVGKGRLVQESDFAQLHYIKACALEAFRLHPIDAFVPPHVSISDTIIGEYFVPKGSHILLSRMGVGRNPRVWDEPHKFKPERHLNNNIKDTNSVVLTDIDLRLISFGIGRRGCPGTILGSSMTMMLFARLLHCFAWSAPPNGPKIDLSETHDGTTLARPLLALAKPRLPAYVYSQI